MADPANGAAALAVSALTKNFSGLTAVSAMSFELIGPNGSGKTTVINLVSGALKPSAGAIRLYGEEIGGAAPAAIARMGVARTFQIVRMLPSMSVLENVMAGGVFGHSRHWGDDLRDRARALVARVGLAVAGETPVSALTYIDQKRVELARALATRPRLLLLDEIAGGLTEHEVRALIENVGEIHAAGTAIIWIEHVVHALLSVVSRLVVLNFGEKLAEGDPQAVMKDPDVLQVYMGIAAE